MLRMVTITAAALIGAAVFAYAGDQGEPDQGCDGKSTPETKAEMKKVLADIQSGRFTRDWMLENKVNQTSFKATRAKLAEHPIEQVGAKLREMMPWIKQRALVDKSKN